MYSEGSRQTLPATGRHLLPLTIGSRIDLSINNIFSRERLLFADFGVLYTEPKTKCMEPIATQQEVLLYTETQFAHRQWAERNPAGSANLSTREKLEKACWDGLIKDLIPELDITLQTDKKLWLWEIHQTVSFLALDFYEYPGAKENEASIDPYLFMDGIRTN
jgi:hypothetical protein